MHRGVNLSGRQRSRGQSDPSLAGSGLTSPGRSRRRYEVIAIEPVTQGGHLLGNVYRIFYHNEAIDINWGEFWERFMEDPTPFSSLCTTELFTKAEANVVLAWVKATFPQLSGVTKQVVQLSEDEPPFRSYPNDGGYSQWDLAGHSEHLGFPVGAFADYDLWDVMLDEPLITIAVGRGPSTCCLCRGRVESVHRLALKISDHDKRWYRANRTPLAGWVCRHCGIKHGPETVARLDLASDV